MTMLRLLLIPMIMLMASPAWALDDRRIQTLSLASDVTTNTTSVATPGVTGYKTFWGQVLCSSGACAQTQEIYGGIVSTFVPATEGVLLCTITLTATTRDQDACATSTAPWPFYKVVTTATSGTGATGNVLLIY